MLDVLTNYTLEILFTVISAGVLWLCRRTHKEMKNYQALIEEKENEKLVDLIEEKLTPVQNKLSDLQNEEDAMEDKVQKTLEIIVGVFKYQFLILCKTRLQQDSLTQGEYDQLIELYKFYHDLGGNGLVKEYYEKAIKLPIRPEE